MSACGLAGRSTLVLPAWLPPRSGAPAGAGPHPLLPPLASWQEGPACGGGADGPRQRHALGRRRPHAAPGPGHPWSGHGGGLLIGGQRQRCRGRDATSGHTIESDTRGSQPNCSRRSAGAIPTRGRRPHAFVGWHPGVGKRQRQGIPSAFEWQWKCRWQSGQRAAWTTGNVITRLTLIGNNEHGMRWKKLGSKHWLRVNARRRHSRAAQDELL